MAQAPGQLSAITGRRSTLRLEDLNRARLPSLYAARDRELAERRIGLDQRALALQERQAGVLQRQQDIGLGIQGFGTVAQGAALTETAFPGTISSLGRVLGIGGSAAAPLAAAPAGAAALAEGAGVAATFPLFGGASTAALPAASGASSAAGLSGAAAGSTVASTVGPTTGLSAAAPASSGLLASAAPILGSAGVGALGGFIGGKIGPHILPFGGETGEQIESGLGGAAVGAGAGFLVGGPVGAVVGGVIGGLTGALSVIATAVEGLDAPETQLAMRFRRTHVGQIRYHGYLRWGTPVARFVIRHPRAKPVVRRLLVRPAIRYFTAVLDGQEAQCPWPTRLWVKAWMGFSQIVGRWAYRRGTHANKRRRVAS